VFAIHRPAPDRAFALYSWTSPTGPAGGIADLRHTGRGWDVVDTQEVPLPSTGEVSRGFSALMRMDLDRSSVVAGFVDPTADVVQLADGEGRIVAEQRPAAAGVLIPFSSEGRPVQVRILRGQSLRAATSMPPVKVAIRVPQWFSERPPDWRSEARAFVDQVTAQPADAARLVYPGFGGIAFVNALHRIITDTPDIVDVRGNGGAYAISLRGDGSRGAQLLLGMTPHLGQPRVVAYDYRPDPLPGNLLTR
jgi:hypothetical protein